VTRFFFPQTPQGAGRLLVWILAVLLPLQATAANALAARGPLHVHRVQAIVVLEDVRRASTQPTVAARHVALAVGHFHARVPERHQHALDDASVVTIDDGASATLDGATALAAAAFAGSAAPPTTPVVWSDASPRDVRATRTAWSPLSRDPERIERPPRAA
jgi:hypothetical protein